MARLRPRVTQALSAGTCRDIYGYRKSLFLGQPPGVVCKLEMWQRHASRRPQDQADSLLAERSIDYRAYYHRDDRIVHSKYDQAVFLHPAKAAEAIGDRQSMPPASTLHPLPAF